MKKLLISLTCLLGLTVFASQAKDYKKPMNKKDSMAKRQRREMRPMGRREMRPVGRFAAGEVVAEPGRMVPCPDGCRKKCCRPMRKRCCPPKKRCCPTPKRRCAPRAGKVCETFSKTVCCPTVTCEAKVTEVPVTKYDIREVRGTRMVPRVEKVCKTITIPVQKTVCEERIVQEEVPDITFEAVPRTEAACITTTDEVCGEKCHEECRKVCVKRPVPSCPCPRTSGQRCPCR